MNMSLDPERNWWAKLTRFEHSLRRQTAASMAARRRLLSHSFDALRAQFTITAAHRPPGFLRRSHPVSTALHAPGGDMAEAVGASNSGGGDSESGRAVGAQTAAGPAQQNICPSGTLPPPIS